MLSGFYNAFKDSELKGRILFTLLSLCLFRIGTHITLPGINPSEIGRFFVDLQKSGGSSSFFDFINMFTGEALGRFAVFGLGVMPYISASIIMTLLQVVVPALERLAKEEGSYGRQKINKYTRYLTILICTIEALGILVYFKTQVLAPATAKGYQVLVGDTAATFSFSFMFILVLNAGTMFLVWLGEQITEKGIGNGVSVIIFAGIVARIPSSLHQAFQVALSDEQGGMLRFIIMLCVFVFFMVLVLILREGERRIPIQYAKRVVGNKMYQGQNTFIPFKVDPSGVIAIIFASSVIMFPSQILGTFAGTNHMVAQIVAILSPGHTVYYILYFLLVVFFCYFYTAIMHNPIEIANQIQKNGGFVPGIRPGQQTALFLEKLLRRLVFPGSLLIGIIALAPDLISSFLGVPRNVARLLGGTTLMILAGVALDTLKQIESKLKAKNLEGFSSGTMGRRSGTKYRK